MKKVEISWLDSKNYAGWHTKDTLVKPSLIQTLGFLVSEDEDAVVVCSCYSLDHYANIIVIPRCSILDYKDIN